MKKTISFFSLFMLLATNFMPLVSFANENWEKVKSETVKTETAGTVETEWTEWTEWTKDVDNSIPKNLENEDSVDSSTQQGNEWKELVELPKIVKNETLEWDIHDAFVDSWDILNTQPTDETNSSNKEAATQWDNAGASSGETNKETEQEVVITSNETKENINEAPVMLKSNRWINLTSVFEWCFILDENDSSKIKQLNVHGKQ